LKRHLVSEIGYHTCPRGDLRNRIDLEKHGCVPQFAAMQLQARSTDKLSKWCLLPLLCHQLSAATLTLPAVSDTSLFENKPDSNLGATTLVSGTNHKYSRSRGLFQFDLTSLPSGIVVTQVEVRLHVTRQPDPDQPPGPVASDFSLHRMWVSWGEGIGSSLTGSVAAAGDATWNERHFANTPWGTPGGLIGTDYAENPSSTTSIGDVGAYVWGSSSTLIEDVQTWVNDPAANFGFILVNESEGTLGSGRRFASTEQSDNLSPAPELVITYLIPEPSAAALLMLTLAAVAFRRGR
jgi:hypothetical protein